MGWKPSSPRSQGIDRLAKLVILMLLASFACKSLLGHWPWTMLGHYLRIAPTGATARARALLGVPIGASREQIIAAHRKLLFEIHPDRGGTESLVHEANAARDVLLGALGPANRAA